MTADLFEACDTAARDVSRSEYDQPYDAWVEAGVQANTLRRDSSLDVYRVMWVAFANWAVFDAKVHFDALTIADLDLYLSTKSGRPRRTRVSGSLSDPYAWRLLRLIDRVWKHKGRVTGEVRASPAAALLAGRAAMRVANDRGRRHLPSALERSDAVALIRHVAEVLPGRARDATPVTRWQDVRDRVSVALMLGAGLSPGELRLLRLDAIRYRAGDVDRLPHRLLVPGRGTPTGTSPERETPIAPWAARLLVRWLQVRREQRIPGDVLFVGTRTKGSEWSKPAQYASAEAVLVAAAGEDPDAQDRFRGGSFRLRHTFAVRQLWRDRSPNHVQRVAAWLGVEPAEMDRYLALLPGQGDDTFAAV